MGKNAGPIEVSIVGHGAWYDPGQMQQIQLLHAKLPYGWGWRNHLGKMSVRAACQYNMRR
jgi:hypothetical protein